MFALLFANMQYFASINRGQPVGWGRALVGGFFDMYMWAFVCLAAFFLAWHLPFDRYRWKRLLLVHFSAMAALILARMIIEHLVAGQLGWWEVPFPQRVLMQGTSHALLYPPLVGVGYAVAYFRRYRERELTASRLEAAMTRAELQALKMQLHPHFLFNTLNAISALMHRDVEAADQMIAQLGDLLRQTLDAAGAQEVPLRDELAFLEPYLHIEQTRLGDRLSVAYDIDPQTYDAAVPHLILQPLVENAVRHGIAPRAIPGQIQITAQREGANLRLQVRDTGPGLSENGPSANGNGVGIANTRARLAALYDGQHRFELRNAPEGGVVADVVIPFRAGGSPPFVEETHEDPNSDRRR